MKKIIPFLLMASLIITACGTGEMPTGAAETSATGVGESTPTEESAVEAVTRIEVREEALKGLQITVWTPWYGVEQGLFETFVREFNAENEWGITVSAQTQINFTNLYETTTASLPTDGRPNLVIALPEHAQKWFVEGVTTNLNEYADDPVYGLDADDFPAVFWEQDLADDARVAIPAQRTTQVLLWNESWAGELNIKSAPASADDFKRQACRAHDAMSKDESAENDALGGWLVDTAPMTAYAWMLSFGGGVLEQGNYRFLSPDNIDAFQFLRELSETNCAWQGAADPIASFVKREALFVTLPLQDLPAVTRAFASADNRDAWRALPFPNEEDGLLAVYGSSYVILESLPEEEFAAWLFVRWLLDNEQDARWVEAVHTFPLRASTLSLLGDYEKTHPHWSAAVELIPLGEMQPRKGSWRTVKVMLGDGFSHMYRVNVSSGQVAVTLAQMDTMAKELSE